MEVGDGHLSPAEVNQLAWRLEDKEVQSVGHAVSRRSPYHLQTTWKVT